MKNTQSIKNGFTLAEILLTMIIIGVVMGLLIRTVARVDPDKDKFLFLKSYHAIEEIIRSSVNDFTKYDEAAIKQMNRNISLIRYKKFGDDLLMFEHLNENVVAALPEESIQHLAVSPAISRTSFAKSGLALVNVPRIK